MSTGGFNDGAVVLIHGFSLTALKRRGAIDIRDLSFSPSFPHLRVHANKAIGVLVTMNHGLCLLKQQANAFPIEFPAFFVGVALESRQDGNDCKQNSHVVILFHHYATQQHPARKRNTEKP